MDLFKKDELLNIFVEFLSDKLKEIDPSDVPDSYKEVVKKNIITEDEFKLGKIKYDDKTLHRSKIIKLFTEESPDKEKIQKDFKNISKKIGKNKKSSQNIKKYLSSTM